MFCSTKNYQQSLPIQVDNRYSYDPGIARVLENKQQTRNATLAYTARYASAETALEETTSFKSDIWSLGILFYEV